VKVLIVDNEPDILLLVRANVRAWGHECLTAGTADEGRRLCAEERPDVLLLDVAMPGENGPAFLESVRRLGAQPRDVVLLSALPPRELSALADSLGVRSLSKPFTSAELRAIFDWLGEPVSP
jgi:DNA-binding response OmpR family regulator